MEFHTIHSRKEYMSGLSYSSKSGTWITERFIASQKLPGAEHIEGFEFLLFYLESKQQTLHAKGKVSGFAIATIWRIQRRRAKRGCLRFHKVIRKRGCSYFYGLSKRRQGLLVMKITFTWVQSKFLQSNQNSQQWKLFNVSKILFALLNSSANNRIKIFVSRMRFCHHLSPSLNCLQQFLCTVLHQIKSAYLMALIIF